MTPFITQVQEMIPVFNRFTRCKPMTSDYSITLLGLINLVTLFLHEETTCTSIFLKGE